jgi:hypothetical protein
MRGICMHQVETRFGFGEFYLHANAGEQEARNVTDFGMQVTVYLDFLVLFTEVPTMRATRVFEGTVAVNMLTCPPCQGTRRRW